MPTVPAVGVVQVVRLLASTEYPDTQAVAKNTLIATPPPEPPWAVAVAVAAPWALTVAAPPTTTVAFAPMKASRLPLMTAVELLPAPARMPSLPTVVVAVAVRCASPRAWCCGPRR